MSRWYAKVPKDPAANRQFRLDVLREARGSAECRSWLKRCCAEDVLFYVNTFSWTYDPRLEEGQKNLPFITFAIQDHAILRINECIDKGRDLVIEKSRDLGASWMCLSVFEWRWHFKGDQTFLCMSRDADEVDKPGYPDSLFAKIDIIHANTPSWLMPQGWNTGGKTPNRKRMTIVNPENGSTINGESTVAAAGVGGRRTAILIDEFSRIEHGYEMMAGTADVTPCRIFNFTPYGTGNASYELATRGNIRKLRLHWSADPRKNNKMYQWDGDAQRYRYFRFNNETLKVEECEPHQYGPEDADTVNFTEDNGFPNGKPFEPIPDGILRSPTYDIEDTRRGNRQAMAMMWDIDYAGTEYNAFDKKMLIELDREFSRTPIWEGDIVEDQGEPVELVEAKNGPLKLWVRPTLNGKIPPSREGFACGADISLGVGATNSCATIADAKTGEKVAEYVTPMEKPDRFASKVVALCRLFRGESGTDTHLAWERNGPGEQFADTVLELGYSNIYYHGVEASKALRTSKKAGWPPTQANKDALLGEYQIALRQRRFINRSTLALQECERFMHTPTGIEYVASANSLGRRNVMGHLDPTGARENHGDRVVADALCFRAIKSMGTLQPLKKADEQDKPAAVGTIEWRRELHQSSLRDLEEAW